MWRQFIYFSHFTLTSSPYSAEKGRSFPGSKKLNWQRWYVNPKFHQALLFATLHYPTVCAATQYFFLELRKGKGHQAHWSFNYFIAHGKDYIKNIHPVLYDVLIKGPFMYLSACLWNDLWIHGDRTEFKCLCWLYAQFSLFKTRAEQWLRQVIFSWVIFTM